MRLGNLPLWFMLMRRTYPKAVSTKRSIRLKLITTTFLRRALLRNSADRYHITIHIYYIRLTNACFMNVKKYNGGYLSFVWRHDTASDPAFFPVFTVIRNDREEYHFPFISPFVFSIVLLHRSLPRRRHAWVSFLIMRVQNIYVIVHQTYRLSISWIS